MNRTFGYFSNRQRKAAFCSFVYTGTYGVYRNRAPLIPPVLCHTNMGSSGEQKDSFKGKECKLYDIQEKYYLFCFCVNLHPFAPMGSYFIRFECIQFSPLVELQYRGSAPVGS